MQNSSAASSSLQLKNTAALTSPKLGHSYFRKRIYQLSIIGS